MKVANTRKVNERIIEYMEREQLNILLREGLCAPISSEEVVYNEPASLLSFATEFRSTMRKSGVDYTEDQSIIASMVMSLLKETIGDPMKIPSAVLDEIIRKGHVFHKGELESNPYYKNIHFEGKKSGRFELSQASYRKYELFMSDSARDCFQGVMIPVIGTVDHRFRFPNIKEGGNTWMSITPSEISTMQKPIENSSGKVLTLGCGMGYFAYMSALKDNVESVTIIEKQPEVIEIFNEFILPQFVCKDKISMVQADAFDYIKALQDGEYDFCFADIWWGNLDTVPYLKMKRLCRRFKQTAFSYWIEDALISTIMGYVFIILLEEFYNNLNTELPQITNLPDDETYKVEFLRSLLRDAEISRPEHVDYYMNYKNILNLMS